MNKSQYRKMWLFVFFDLPTETKTDRRVYTQFRKRLLNSGFSMMQFSVYNRFCGSHENLQSHIKQIEKILPKKGKVSLMSLTDKQFENIKHYWGVEEIEPPKPPQQLSFF